VNGRATVTVVDDEPGLADLFAAWLEGTYEVRTAYGGRQALDVVDDGVDVVLVDRLMPDASGDEVVTALTDRGWDGGIAMVTAVEPDFDVVELGLDDYLVKPVHREMLESTVERLLERATHDGPARELLALTSKRAILETRKSEVELTNSREYRRLTRAIVELRDRVDGSAVGLDDAEPERAFRRPEQGRW
jgi:DNA-binding response OmpR family regulator